MNRNRRSSKVVIQENRPQHIMTCLCSCTVKHHSNQTKPSDYLSEILIGGDMLLQYAIVVMSVRWMLQGTNNEIQSDFIMCC